MAVFDTYVSQSFFFNFAYLICIWFGYVDIFSFMEMGVTVRDVCVRRAVYGAPCADNIRARVL